MRAWAWAPEAQKEAQVPERKDHDGAIYETLSVQWAGGVNIQSANWVIFGRVQSSSITD
jgi:hypothetical protein